MKWSFITDGNYINFRHTDETDLHIQQIIHRLHNTSRCIDWSLPIDTTRITFTIDESKYENISIYDIDFDGAVMNVQGDFETNITAMFSGLAGGGSSSYLVYTALLNQDGTPNNPVPTILGNTIGDIVWEYGGSNGYNTGTLAGAFPLGKTFIIMGNTFGNKVVYAADINSAPDSIYIQSFSDGVSSNGLLSNSPIEIRVYP